MWSIGTVNKKITYTDSYAKFVFLKKVAKRLFIDKESNKLIFIAKLLFGSREVDCSGGICQNL